MKNRVKNNNDKINQTLDLCHKRKTEEFRKNAAQLKKFEKELETIKETLASIGLNGAEDIDKFALIKRENELERLIEDIKTGKNEIEYYNKIADLLFDYYNRDMEDKSHIINLTNFFDTNVNIYDTTARSTALREYLHLTDNKYIDDSNQDNQDINPECENCETIMEYLNDSVIICPNCNMIKHIFIENDRNTCSEVSNEISYFSYNRMNHFSEWINQIQGKETTDIPDEVFNTIYRDLQKNKITNMASLTTEKIKSILKANGFNRYYEHGAFILNRISGRNNPHFTAELEDKLRNMFRDIQTPFLKYAPKSRKNFLSYSYVLYKFLQLLNETEYLEYFVLLKSRDKLYQQELIWKNICADLGWQFIPSM
jgi:hypothetical protein